MLQSDPDKLRFLGIDLRSRFRRRCAVVLTFMVFFIAMTTLTVSIDRFEILRHYRFGALLLMLAVSTIFSLGIFREGVVVKAFNEPVWKLKGIPGGAVMVRSLDELAEYRFGGRFDDLPAAQQNEVLASYRVGNYLFLAASSHASSRLDERERIEKDRAYSKTLAWLTRYLFTMAAIYAVGKSNISRADVAALLITLGFIGLNGPKATILWNEPPPPSNDELHIIDHHDNVAM